MESQTAQQLNNDAQSQLHQNSENSIEADNSNTSSINESEQQQPVQEVDHVMPPQKRKLKSCGWYNGVYICT